MKRTNKAGVSLIQQFEGLSLKAYRCPAGVLTIGYGHTGSDVREGMTITREHADQLLFNDLRRFEQAVEELCPVTTDNQFAALVSFAFNVGADALRKSTLRKLHNLADYCCAQKQFARWNKAGGKILPGLVKRRNYEAELYGRP